MRKAGTTSGAGQIFAVTSITPTDVFSSARVRAMVLNELKRQGRRAKTLLDMTTEYWKDRPAFRDTLHYAGGNVYLVVAPYGTTRAVDYWQKVNDGTSVRYTRFIPSYRPKTSFPAPDSLVGASGPGVNTGPERIAFVDRNHPQPGIRGRHWDNKVYLLMESDFATGIQEAINRGLQPK